MWGKLPVPKYIAHTIYADNAVTEVAFRQGEIDVGQIFVPNVQDLWEEEGLPVSGYMMEEPYGICLTMPTAWYNLNNPVLQDATLRKAIAIAVDYDAIIENAITNQSPTFEEVPRSCMNPTEVEQAMYDHEAVADLQWTGNDVEGAIAMLEEAGYVDNQRRRLARDADGEGDHPDRRLPRTAGPTGRPPSSLVAAAGANIGINITTVYPESSTYSTVYQQPEPDGVRHLHAVLPMALVRPSPGAGIAPVHVQRLRRSGEQLQRQLRSVLQRAHRRDPRADPDHHPMRKSSRPCTPRPLRST